MGVDSTHMFPTSRGVNPATDLICSVLHHTRPFNSPVPDLVPLLGDESCPSTILQRSLDFNSFNFQVLSVPTADVGGWAPPLTRLKWIFGATEGRRPPALSLTMWTLILFICPPLPWWKPFVDQNIFSSIQGYGISGDLSSIRNCRGCQIRIWLSGYFEWDCGFRKDNTIFQRSQISSQSSQKSQHLERQNFLTSRE